jgi:hypothetical protein
MSSVRVATPADRAQTVSVLTDAFAADPVVRWIFPDDTTYPARAETFFRLDERMGFVVTGTVDDPDLPFGWCMCRQPA